MEVRVGFEPTCLSMRICSPLHSTALPSYRDWYSDRYETVVSQRNLLIVFSVLLFVAIIVSVAVVGKVSTSKSFSPFVIQIEERSGSAKVVNPADSNLLSGNESLTRYFIKKYVVARESYNPVDFESNIKKVVRLFSVPQVYRDLMGYIKNPEIDPSIVYAQKNTTYVKINSYNKLDDKYFVRFSVIETGGAKNVFNKVATISVEFRAMELTDEEKDINPVGFQVTGYGVADDGS